MTGPGLPGSISGPLSLGSCCGCPSFLSTLFSHSTHPPTSFSSSVTHTPVRSVTEECCGVHSLRSKGNDRLGLSSGNLSGGSGRPGTLAVQSSVQPRHSHAHSSLPATAPTLDTDQRRSSSATSSCHSEGLSEMNF